MRRQRSWRDWIPVWVFPVSVVFAIGTVWLRLVVVRTTYELSQQEQSVKNLRREQEQMELKLAGLRSPRRLEKLARSQFGLEVPAPGRVVHLNR